MEWKDILAPVMKSQEMQETKAFLAEERKIKNIYPDSKDTFQAFNLCPYESVRVVLLGQDPYHTPGTADGLAFSTRQQKRPPSLDVIFKEIYTDLNIEYYRGISYQDYFPNNNLIKWAQNGFLLLNTTLTVEEGKANSHKGKWNKLVEAVFKALMLRKETIIFLLWGTNAKSYKELILEPHIYFEASHPASELYNQERKDFTGCRHFSLLRDILPTIKGQKAIQGNLDHEFVKNDLQNVIEEGYPRESAKLKAYINNGSILNCYINREVYKQEMRKFESIISTGNFNF